MAHPRRSPEEIERGLTALILAGSSVKAEEVCGIPQGTLRAWKSQHPEQYERLQNDLEPRIVKKIAGEAEGIVLRLADLQHQVLSEFEETMGDLKPAELAAASRNLATTSALYVDKHSSPLRERPSHVQQDGDMQGLLMRMARAMGTTYVPNEADHEGTAVSLISESSVANAQDTGPELDPPSSA
jgi:hypothetical protein